MRNQTFRLALLLIGAAAVAGITPFFGTKTISPHALLTDTFVMNLFTTLRLPRMVTAFLAGGGLALCGMVYQAMFRNPLADPFTLGISSGASCGAAATILFGAGGAFFGIPIIALGAFCGAACAMLMVFALASLQRFMASLSILLAGIAVSFMFSSVLMLLQFLSSQKDSFNIIRWLMGGLEVFGFGQICILLPFILIGGGIVFILLPSLDQLYSGEDIAHSRGVNVSLVKKLLIAATTLMVGSIVALCGPIGFVGMIAPHVCKMLFPLRHRILGPVSFVLGGTFLVACDTIARTIIAPAEMPAGVVTALVGAPFFLWLLFLHSKKSV